jgi:hypothetical protein
MRAMVCRAWGAPDVLQLENVPPRALRLGEVRCIDNRRPQTLGPRRLGSTSTRPTRHLGRKMGRARDRFNSRLRRVRVRRCIP